MDSPAYTSIHFVQLPLTKSNLPLLLCLFTNFIKHDKHPCLLILYYASITFMFFQ